MGLFDSAKRYLNPKSKNNIWNSPFMRSIEKPIVGFQRFIESNKSSADLVPQIPQQIRNIPFVGEVANAARDIPTTIFGKGIVDPAIDIGNIIGKTVFRQQAPQYNTFKSAPVKLGAQIGANINPEARNRYGISEKGMLENAIASAAPPLYAHGIKTAAGNLGNFGRFAGTSSVLGGIFGAGGAALEGKKPSEIIEEALRSAGEFAGRSPHIYGVVKGTDPYLAATIGKYSLPIQKALSRVGLDKISQPLVRRGLPAVLNVAQGVPVDVALGRTPLTKESIGVDLFTGALLPGMFDTPQARLQQEKIREGINRVSKIMGDESGFIKPDEFIPKKVVGGVEPPTIKIPKELENAPKIGEVPMDSPTIKKPFKASELKEGQKFFDSLPLNELRRRQDLIQQQIKIAYDAKDTTTLSRLQDIDKQLQKSVLKTTMEGPDFSKLKPGQNPIAMIEEFEGWKPGMKTQFDTAIARKDASMLRKLLPEVPPDYRAKFAKNIDSILQTDQTSIKQGITESPPSTPPPPKIPDDVYPWGDPINENVGGKQRGFLKTVSESPTSTNDLKRMASEIDPQTYEVSPNKDSLEFANDIVNKNIEEARRLVLSTDSPMTAEKSATAVKLLEKFDKEGDYESAKEILNSYDNQLREAGRFVQAASIWNKLSPTGMVRMTESIANKKGVEIDDSIKKTIYDNMSRIKTIGDKPVQDKETLKLLNSIADLFPPTTGELLESYRYQNMLSNPRTHLRNVYYNLFNTFITRPIDLAIESEYDILRHPFNPLARDSSIADVPKYYKHVFASTSNAFEAAIQVFKNSDSIDNKLDMRPGRNIVESLRKENVPGILKTIPNLMTASDVFFQTLIAAGEKARLMSHGMEDIAADEGARKLAKEYLVRQPLGADALDKTKPLLVRALDSLGQHALDGRKLPVIGKAYSWFVPFVTTPINVAKVMVSHSPLGLFGGGMDKRQVSQAVGGSLVTFGAALMALNDKVTWAAPVDSKAKDLFYGSGRKPYSVKINDKWIPLWYFGPYALAMALPAAVKHYYETDKKALTDNAVNKIGRISMDISKFIASQTPLSGISGFFRLVEGDSDASPGTLLGFTAGQLIPMQGLIRYVNSILDPVYRKSKGFTDSLLKDVSALSQTGIIPELEAHTDPYGEKAKRDPINYVLPYDIGYANTEFDEPLKDRIEQMKEASALNEMNLEMEKDEGTFEPTKVARKLFNELEAAPTKKDKIEIIKKYAKDGRLNERSERALEEIILEKAYAITGAEKALRNSNMRVRANFILKKLKKLKTKEEKLNYIKRMRQIKVLTSGVEEEMVAQIQQQTQAKKK